MLRGLLFTTNSIYLTSKQIKAKANADGPKQNHYKRKVGIAIVDVFHIEKLFRPTQNIWAGSERKQATKQWPQIQ